MAEQKRLSGAATGLMAFMPLVLYGFASGANHWRVATGGGLILCLVFLAVRLHRGISIKLMDWTTLIVFVIGSVLMIGLHSTVFPAYSVVVIWSCFAVAAWSSVVIGHPFTVAYARENEPPEFWDNPVFIRLNLVMTLFWCGLMTVNVGFAVIGVIIGGNFGKLVPGFVLPTALLIFGFVFNSRFPARYMARAGYQGEASKPDGFQRVARIVKRAMGPQGTLLGAHQLGFVGGEGGVNFAIDLPVALERLFRLLFVALFPGDFVHLLFDPRQMPRFVFHDGLQDFHRLRIDVGQRDMRVVAALRALFDHDRQCEQIDNRFGHAGAKSEPALVAVVDKDRSAAQIRDSLGP